MLFRERVSWRNWAAVLLSFLGVIIAIQPGAAAFQPASLLILACAFLYAAISLTSRWLPREENPWTVSFLGAAFAALFVAPLTIGKWTELHLEDLFLFASAAFCSSFGSGRLARLSLGPGRGSGAVRLYRADLVDRRDLARLGAIPGAWTLIGAAVVASSSLFYLITRRPDPQV